MELKGFDCYEITLGDEMRGERASLGKSLEDAERELRIKAKMITAIEDCDLTGFTNQSVIAGYVRSYARYLGMNAEDCYQRFCEESGYKSPAALMSTSGDGSGFQTLNKTPDAMTANVGKEIASSRFAAPPRASRFTARISFGAIGSTAALLALVGGLSYGGYALLQDIQRVGFQPLPDAPVVVAAEPQIELPDISTEQIARPTAQDYEGGGALAALAPQQDLPRLTQLRRDGPISAINPADAGIFAQPERPNPSRLTAGELFVDLPDGETVAAAGPLPGQSAPAADGQRGIVLHATAEAWIRVYERDNSTVWQGTLAAGEHYRLPDQVTAPMMRSGAAGATFVVIDGIAYGPLGKPGSVARKISLSADDVRNAFPEANLKAFAPAADDSTEQRAAADVPRP